MKDTTKALNDLKLAIETALMFRDRLIALMEKYPPVTTALRALQEEAKKQENPWEQGDPHAD